MVELTDNIPWNNQYTTTTSEDLNNCEQLLKKAEILKKKISSKGGNLDFKEIGDKLVDRLTLQDLYRKLLISNLEYALDKKIEQDLWNVVFKNFITTLQQKSKDKANVKRSDVQSQLTVFLEAASGFYAQLLQDLCQIFHLSVPCRIPVSLFPLANGSHGPDRHNVISQPERPSCQYMCQHCLVHLGDIARYRSQSGQAESYYRHAAQLVPSNGQPYNQLAILAAASGDMLSMAFYYCRSLAVKCPFPASSTNLKRQLAKIMDSDEPRHAKISISELKKYFLKFHACIYLKKHEENLEKMSERLASYIHLHLRTGSLNQQHLVHMTFLNLFSLCHRTLLLSTSPIADKQQSEQIKNGLTLEQEQSGTSWKVLLSFSLQLLDLFLTCIPVYSEMEEDFQHMALPAIKLSLDWLTTATGIIEKEEMVQYPRLWNNLASLLNALKTHEKLDSYSNLPLPEDLELRGFIGLKESLNKWNFTRGCESVVEIQFQHKFRCHRLLDLGLTIFEKNAKLLKFSQEENENPFSSPLEYTKTSPVDILMNDDSDFSVDSPTPGSGGRYKSNEVKIERNKDRAARKTTSNVSQNKADKLNAIKEENSLDDLKKQSTNDDSVTSETGKSSHRVTFSLPVKQESESVFHSISPSDHSWPPRNGITSPVLTPEEMAVVENINKLSPGAGTFQLPNQIPPNQYRNMMEAPALIRAPFPPATSIQDLATLVQRNPFVHLPHTNANLRATIPSRIPTQADTMPRISQFTAQQPTINPYQMIDPIQNLISKTQVQNERQNMSNILAPRFQRPPTMPVSYIPRQVPNTWNAGTSLQQQQHNITNIQPNENFQLHLKDMRNFPINHSTNNRDVMGEEYMPLFKPKKGISPDSSNTTSSTSSPTPGVKPSVTNISPHAGTRVNSGTNRPAYTNMDFPNFDAEYTDNGDLMQQHSNEQGFSRYMSNTESYRQPDMDFSGKPFREDGGNDLLDTITPGNLLGFDKPGTSSYKLFPDNDSTWSIGQRNSRNGNKLGSIGSERAIAHQQLIGGNSLSKISSWANSAYPQFPSNQSTATPADTNYQPPDSFWSSQIDPSGPSKLEQLIRQQQENVGAHKPPP